MVRTRKARIKWTEEMNNVLLECKKKAITISRSEQAPRKENGRKKGYMCIMKELWDDSEYVNLQLTSQNLRDKAARLEKTLGNVTEVIVNNMRPESTEYQLQEQQRESRNLNLIESNETEELITTTTNLHIDYTQSGMDDLMESANKVLLSVNQVQGDFSMRNIDTRTKESPTKRDIESINYVVTSLMKQENVSPINNPFEFLWTASCVLYSVVIAFLLYKGWKKHPSKTTDRGKINKMEQIKAEYEKKVMELRKKISITKEEVERIKTNRKLTNRGRRNRDLIKSQCKDMSVSGLISYIEKNKCALRKLKKAYIRKKKQEESRSLNNQFKTDPSRVYSKLSEVVKQDEDNERPVYTNQDSTQREKQLFDDIDEAAGFWKELWEKEGTGNPSAIWFTEIKGAIHNRVRASTETEWFLYIEEVIKVIRKKKNWSSPGPDRIVNFWWKNAYSIHKDLAICFQSIVNTREEYPEWFAGGRTTLIPKPGPFTSENQRPITCLNTVYKLFTSCLLIPIDKHLDRNKLMEGQQRGARKNCSGTVDNLLIDRMVALDCYRRKRNLSAAWIDVRKAYDTVDHSYLSEVMEVHRFPNWLNDAVRNLCRCWNTRVNTHTKRFIRFKRGLPQGDALCPRLFTLCLNPLAWKLAATEGYRMSKPINAKITDVLYIDDLKVYAQSESKLSCVLRNTNSCMEDIGLQLNPKKCNVIHVKRGEMKQDVSGIKVSKTAVIQPLKEDSHYKFLGILENVRQEEKHTLACAEKTYLQRLSVIWSSPLSDANRVVASNQFALAVLKYPMWTQHWPLTELRRIDREARKVIVMNGGKHPASSIALLYLPREKGGRGLQSVEGEYKLTKIKVAMKLYSNNDPNMKVVREFEERAAVLGHQSLITEVQRYSDELGLSLKLVNPEPMVCKADGEEVSAAKAKGLLRSKYEEQMLKTVSDEAWQGKFHTARWDDDSLNIKNCFSWLKNWTRCPTYVVAGMYELYEQLLPTRLYQVKKTKTLQSSNMYCRMCNKAPEYVAHVLSGCSALAQNKYLARHNNALKVLYFELLRELQLVESVPAWYSPIKPKPEYISDNVQALWDIPTYGENHELQANRIDAKIVNHKSKEVVILEMSCPWIENREKKNEEKTVKYGPLRWELMERYPGYKIHQYNIIMDVLGGWSKSMEEELRKLLGKKTKYVLQNMQRVVVSSTLNIARTFKILT